MEPTEILMQLYRDRLAGLSAVLNSLPEMVTEDEAVSQLATMPALARYRTDRILELTSNLLHDEKQLTIIAVLQALHRSQSDSQRLQELLSSEKQLRREVEEQLQHSLNRKWKGDSITQHQSASSKDLSEQQFDQSSTEKLMEMKLRNNDLEREVAGLRSQLYQYSSATKPSADFEQQKLQLQIEQLKQLREYLLGQLKKSQMKLSEKQLQCDSLQQRQTLLEQQNCTLSAGNRRLNAELEHHYKQEGSEQLNKSIRLENNKLAQQLEDAQMKHRVEVQSLSDTLARIRNGQEEEKDALHREIRNLKELQHQHFRVVEDKNLELRRLGEEVDKLKQRDDKLTYEYKLKAEQLQRSQAELEMKRKEIHKLSQIFEEERVGYECALKQHESTRRGDDRRRNHKSYLSPQHRIPAHRTGSRFGEHQEFEQVNEEISRLENELNSLRSGFDAAKQRSKQSMEESIHQLRRGILTLRRAIEKIIRLTQQEMIKMVRQLEGKARHLLVAQRNDHKLKVDQIKQLCDEQIALIVQKAKLEEHERQAEHAEIRRELAQKEGHLRAIQSENHKTRQIIEASENLEQSYSALLKQYDELSKKYHELANHQNSNGHLERVTTRSPQVRSQSPQPQINGYQPYSRQKQLMDKQLLAQRPLQTRIVDRSPSQGRQKSDHNSSGVFGKTRQDNLRPDPLPKQQPSPNKSRQLESRHADPTIKKLDDSTNILNNSRRLQLENGFNELEDEIEAIIQRRNKRVNKYLK